MQRPRSELRGRQGFSVYSNIGTALPKLDAELTLSGRRLVLCKITDAFALILEWARRGAEVLPATVLAVLLAGRLVVIQRAVHVGVVDQHRLAAGWAIVAHQENVRDGCAAVARLRGSPGVVERTTGQLRRVDEAHRRKQVARRRPHVRDAAGVARRRPDIGEDGAAIAVKLDSEAR